MGDVGTTPDGARWQALEVQPIDRDRRALIVGNGPSSGGGNWLRLYEALRRESPTDLVLMNLRARGGQVLPDYAVSVDPEILGRSYPELGPACTVVTNWLPRVVLGHELELCTALGTRLRTGGRFWPTLASGPLAAWAMSALGYGTILIFGLDGSVADPRPNATSRPPPYPQVGTWETWLRKYHQARTGDRGKPARLVRVWPDRRWAALKDPLSGVLADTLYADDIAPVPAPPRKKQKPAGAAP